MTPALRDAIVAGALGAAVAFVVLLSWRTLRRLRRRRADRLKELAERQPEKRAELARRLGCGEPELPELGGWKITPDFACLLLDLVDELRPARVLELGAGSSTLLLARALRSRGGRLASLEQDGAHVAATRERLRALGLDAVARVEHAPLAPWPEAREGEPPWYDASAIARLAGEHGPPWDLVIVDGPSTIARADARFPALPRLLPHLSPRAVLVLDDTIRPGERAIVAAWRGLGLLSDFDAQELPLARGAVVLRRR